MYEEPILADNVVVEGVSAQDINLDSNVDALDRTSQEPVKSKIEEDAQYKIRSKKLILNWGLVFTFFR
jgi:hypothetical protein